MAIVLKDWYALAYIILMGMVVLVVIIFVSVSMLKEQPEDTYLCKLPPESRLMKLPNGTTVIELLNPVYEQCYLDEGDILWCCAAPRVIVAGVNDNVTTWVCDAFRVLETTDNELLILREPLS